MDKRRRPGRLARARPAGDHLHDATWFEFWASFHPPLDIDLLLTQPRHRRTGTGVDVSAEEPGRWACLLHVGLDHIAYNTTTVAWTDVDDVVARMHDLRLV